jgi:hypothetical protein
MDCVRRLARDTVKYHMKVEEEAADEAIDIAWDI